MTRSPWWPALAWAAAILIGTSIPGSELARVPAGVDKVVHFALYAPLGALVGRALRGSPTRHAVIAALVVLAAFAGLDELHQMYVPGRSADRIDWVADVIGATAGLLARVPPIRRSEQRT